MISSFFTRALRALPPEIAHAAALRGLSRWPMQSGQIDPVLETDVAGLRLRSPIGLAAGFDKDAIAYAGALRAGFGFVECGTVTPKAQAGNPKPRVFRLTADKAIINRLGFNNQGLERAAARLGRRSETVRKLGPVGVNLGANATSDDRARDYALGLERMWPLVDYVTINISSPNTPGLRNLQYGDDLSALLDRLGDVHSRLACGQAGLPVFLKVAPDLDEHAIDSLAAAVERAACVTGLVVSNTTVSRPPRLSSAEAGGLSGRPLLASSTRVLGAFAQRLGPSTPMIGVGGVDSGEAAYAKIRAGAAAVQLYTGLVYQGPGLVQRIARELASLLKRDGFAALQHAIGADL